MADGPWLGSGVAVAASGVTSKVTVPPVRSPVGVCCCVASDIRCVACAPGRSSAMRYGVGSALTGGLEGTAALREPSKPTKKTN